MSSKKQHFLLQPKTWLVTLTFIASAQLGYASTSSVAQLKSIIQAQQKQLAQQSQELKSQQAMLASLAKRVDKLSTTTKAQAKQTTSNTKRLIAIKTVAAPSNPATNQQQNPASGHVVTSIPQHQLVLGTNKANIAISGHINVMAMQANNGKYNRPYIGSSSNSMSRLNIDSAYKATKDITVGSQIQFGFNVNPTGTINNSNNNTSSLDVRRAELYVKSKKWGELLFGKGSMASDNTAYADFSGTELVSTPTVDDVGGGFYFYSRGPNGAAGPQVSDAFNGLDGLSRKIRIRYDSPSFYGLGVSTSVMSGGGADAALRFGKTFGKTKVAFDAAYTSPQTFNSGTSNEAHGNEANGSASILLPCGVSLTGAYGVVMAEESGRRNPHYYYVKPGYQFNYFKTGLTALSVDYGRYYNFAQNRDTGIVKGIQAVQNLDPLNMAVFAGYRQFVLKRPGTDFRNVNIYLLGAYYKF